MKKIFLSFIFVILICDISFCAEKSILVNQPAYNSMSFYVYKPVNLHKDFYVTYDGYLVYKAENGIWHYGSAEKNGIIKTGYVVGSVIPSVVKLNPYDSKISSVAPIYNPTIKKERKITPVKKTESKSENVYVPPAYALEVYEPVILSPNAVDWTKNSNFMAIGKWQKSIDRIGILEKPQTPVAWKGDYPEVIYAWTGLQWRQLNARGKNISAVSTLRRENYSLTVQTNKLNILRWSDYDSHVLSQYSLMWGYKWLGMVLIGRDF